MKKKVSYKLKPQTVSDQSPALLAMKSRLNEQQWEAVCHGKGPQLIIAGAGTGKTRTLTYRVAWLIEKGVAPERILLLTFTRKAAREMTRRAASIADRRCHKVQSGTFHSFANSILRLYGSELGYAGNFSILDSSDSADVLNYLRTREGLGEKGRRFAQKATLQKVFSRMANTGEDLETILAEDYPQYLEDLDAFHHLHSAYKDYKKSNNMMDYDDLMINLRELLSGSEAIRNKLRADFRYVIIDEYQDTNTIQAEIALLLCGPDGNISVVGDDAQSIYSFRGANHANIFKFAEEFSNAVQNTLEENYRSTPQILNFCNAVLNSNNVVFPKKLFSTIEDGELPVRIDTETLHQQAAFVCQHILNLREEGVSLSQIAVLFRSAYHSNELEIVLSRSNIPFEKHGGIRFIEAAHIKDLLAFLRIRFNPRDHISWQRTLLQIEGVGPGAVRDLQSAMGDLDDPLEALILPAFTKRKYGKALKRLYEHQKEIPSTIDHPVPEALETAIRWVEPLIERNYDDWNRRVMDFEALRTMAVHFSQMESFLSELSLDPPDKTADHAPPDPDEECVVLSTIHSAKGLEFHSVFIINLSEGYFPAPYAGNKPEGLEEERRLFYVACTRAEKNLFLLSPRAWDRGQDFLVDTADVSRFLEDIPPDLYEEWELEEEEEEL